MKIAFRNSDTAVKKETWHFKKENSHWNVWSNFSYYKPTCLLNPTKMKYINLIFFLNPEIQWFPILDYDSKFLFI